MLTGPSESLVASFSADSFVKCRKLGKACRIILFKRLEFLLPLLGMMDYEKQFQERKLRALQKNGQVMGFKLVPTQTIPAGVC